MYETVNIERMEILAAHMLAHPAEIEMADWHCGSHHCIAGTAECLFMPAHELSAAIWDFGAREHAFKGAELLGLQIALPKNDRCFEACDEDSEAGQLFFVAEWPEQFHDRYVDIWARFHNAGGITTMQRDEQQAQVIYDYLQWIIAQAKTAQGLN